MPCSPEAGAYGLGIVSFSRVTHSAKGRHSHRGSDTLESPITATVLDVDVVILRTEEIDGLVVDGGVDGIAAVGAEGVGGGLAGRDVEWRA